MGNAVLNMANWFLGLAAWVASLVTICGGVKYFLARGNKEKEKRAAKMFIYGLVGLFVASFIFVVLLPTAPPLSHQFN